MKFALTFLSIILVISMHKSLRVEGGGEIRSTRGMAKGIMGIDIHS